jgi:ABC-type Na+ efflux pump permease subunit
MKTGNAVVGILGAMATGMLLGIYVASKRKDSRKNISKKGQDLANAINDKIDEKFSELMNSITVKVKKEKIQNPEEAKQN